MSKPTQRRLSIEARTLMFVKELKHCLRKAQAAMAQGKVGLV